jgi:hypothetical protein
MSIAKITINHDEIRKWAEARGGKPATVKSTRGANDPGLLRINFPGYRGEQTLEEITWDDFFQKFEDKNLAFLYQELTSEGKESRFFKLINRSGRIAEKGRKEKEAVGV